MTTTATSRVRSALRSWGPIAIVALLCVGVVIAVIAVQNSWWNDPDRVPSDQQAASDGMSVFTDAGMDFLTREGEVRIKVRADALPASQLGLEPNGTQSFAPLVPIEAVVLGADGAFRVALVRSFTIETRDDRVHSIELLRETNGMWVTVSEQLAREASAWGWTDDDLAALQDALTAASRSASGDRYSAELPAVPHKGALASARIIVDTESPHVTVLFRVSRLD